MTVAIMTGPYDLMRMGTVDREGINMIPAL